jgi:hypothetical protein
MVPDALLDITTNVQSVMVKGLEVHHADYPLPYHDAKPWSICGRGTVAHGRVYSTIGDHDSAGTGTPYDGNSYVFEYDPGTGVLRAVGDALSSFGMHVNAENGYGKVHGRVNEGPCGWCGCTPTA